jgi:hypothetical protein
MLHRGQHRWPAHCTWTRRSVPAPIRQLKTYQSLQRRLTGNAKHPRSTNRQELRPGQKRIKSIRSEPQNPPKSHIDIDTWWEKRDLTG